MRTPRLLGGRYEVGDLIGRGGMAEVHRAYDTRLGRDVAVKILRSDHARDASFLHRFRREAQSVAGLNHPSIVAVYDSGEDSMTEPGGGRVDIPYIVMEYVRGRTLREVLNESGSLDVEDACVVVESVLDALAYSHERGIVHRDIKPGNVMIAEDGAVKVMDFGIARAVADAQATMTQTQAVVGTAQYISPEQAEGQTVDHRSDVYSAGCLLFELLTGRTPFVGEPISLTYQHVRKPPPVPSTLASELPTDMDAVVAHSLEKDRTRRYPDAETFRADLERVRTHRPISAPARASLAALIGAPAVAAATGATAAPTEVLGGAAPTEQLVGPPNPATQPVRRAPVEEWSTSTYPAAKDRRRGGALAWVLVGLALLGALLLGLFAYSQWQENREYRAMLPVPNVVGTDIDIAKKRLDKDFTVTAREVDSQKPKGQVISQDPASKGEEGILQRNGLVTLTYSGGPGSTQVPDLEGMTIGEAKKALEDAGLRLGDRKAVDTADQPQGRVVSTDPGALTNQQKGTEVDVTYSSGKVRLPDLTGKTTDEARKIIDDLGLPYPKVTERTTDEAEAGTVIAQNPAPGAIRNDQVVAIIIAKAPDKTVTSPPPSETPTPTPSEPTDTGTPSEPTDTGTPKDKGKGNGKDPKTPTDGPTSTEPPLPTDPSPTAGPAPASVAVRPDGWRLSATWSS